MRELLAAHGAGRGLEALHAAGAEDVAARHQRAVDAAVHADGAGNQLLGRVLVPEQRIDASQRRSVVLLGQRGPHAQALHLGQHLRVAGTQRQVEPREQRVDGGRDVGGAHDVLSWRRRIHLWVLEAELAVAGGLVQRRGEEAQLRGRHPADAGARDLHLDVRAAELRALRLAVLGHARVPQRALGTRHGHDFARQPAARVATLVAKFHAERVGRRQARSQQPQHARGQRRRAGVSVGGRVGFGAQLQRAQRPPAAGLVHRGQRPQQRHESGDMQSRRPT